MHHAGFIDRPGSHRSLQLIEASLPEVVIIATASRPQPGHRVLDLEGDLVINRHDIGFTNALATLLPGS